MIKNAAVDDAVMGF